VVGAGAKYGSVALTVAMTVKLARALWIVPLTLGTAGVRAYLLRAEAPAGGPRKAIAWPWFILFFLGAASLNTYVPALGPAYPWLSSAGRVGLRITLFLIGTGMSWRSLRSVGVRPLLQGVILWIVVAAGSLAAIRVGWV
jgi:uncharacterized membrane protein YadS